ncbi:hypothetical protein ACET3Z_013847 [Daucus carota]
MLRSNMEPDEFTYGCVFRACAGSQALNYDMEIHGRITKSGITLEFFVGNVLVDMSCKWEEVEEVKKLQNKMEDKTIKKLELRLITSHMQLFLIPAQTWQPLYLVGKSMLKLSKGDRPIHSTEYQSSVSKVAIHNIPLPKLSTVSVGGVINEVKVELAHANAKLELLEVFNDKINKATLWQNIK